MQTPRRTDSPTRQLTIASLVLVLACLPLSARADDASAPDAPEEVPAPGALPALIALGPGLLVHGAGHFMAGDSTTGWRLLALEGASILALFGGATALALSGGSYRIAPLAIPIIGAGVGGFLTSGFADAYGSLFGDGGLGTMPARSARFQGHVGYRHLYDPQFQHGNLAYLELEGRIGAWRFQPRAWLALDDDTQRVHATVAYRFFGPTPRASPGGIRDHLDLEIGLIYHHQSSENFSVLTPEARLHARLDLERLADTLHGAFVDFGLGVALELYDYHLPGLDLGEDANEMLLMSFAVGAAFGEAGERPHGEAKLYYGHRRDGWTHGLAVGSAGGGFLGHFGADITFHFNTRWGMRAKFEVGGAYLTGLDLIIRAGAPGSEEEPEP